MPAAVVAEGSKGRIYLAPTAEMEAVALTTFSDLVQEARTKVKADYLGAVLRAGFAITGTWPMRTEREGRTIGLGSNALASSIVLVCRQRDTNATTLIVDEVVQQFTARVGVDVEISVEIRAKSKDGFGESVQRTIRENCHVLKFRNVEFE